VKIYQRNIEENSLLSVFTHVFLLYIVFTVPENQNTHIYNKIFYVGILLLILAFRIILIYKKDSLFSKLIAEFLIYATGFWWSFLLSFEYYVSSEFDMLLSVLLFLVVGITSGGALSMFKRKRMVVTYIIILMFPTIISVYFNGKEMSNLLSGGLVFFIAFNIIYSIKQNKIWKNFQDTSVRIKDQSLELQASNLELNHALIKSNEAAKAKSEFLANMSHEIRTPMNGVIGAADILRGFNLDQEGMRLVDIIYQSATSLLSIINDILDFSKIEAGKLVIDKSVFDLSKTVDNVVEIIKHTLTSNNVELIVYIDPRIDHKVECDETRVTQVLINLLGNAVKFTLEGQIFLKVDLFDEMYDSYTIKFSIEDTGIGIPSEKQKKIFDSFTQAEGSTTRKFGGTGLGTTISKMIVDVLGGTMGLVSPNPNNTFNDKGSIFYFLLKMRKGDSIISDTFVDIDFQIRKALIIDDNETNCYVLSRMLLKCGIKSIALHKASDAISLLANNPNFDIIFLDYNMPDFTGLEVFQKVKNKLFPHTKTIMISSNSVDVNHEIISKSGIDMLLYKPLKQSEIFDSLQRIFNQKDTEKKVHKSNYLPDFGLAHILLVEDNIINQKIAISVLKQINLKVDVANNGEEALQRLVHKSYDVVFMDIQMPVLDGIETVKNMRKNGNLTPVIAMTANAMKGDRELCLNAGMNDYISKPFKKEDLYQILEKYLGTEIKDQKKRLSN